MYRNIDYNKIDKPFIAMYGGSFNPIHTGHTQLAKYFINELKLKKLLLIPDGTPPHKSSRSMVSAQHRFNMCKLAVKNERNIEVSDIEINRQGKSYTVDTLQQLSEIYRGSQLFLIMGADMYLSLTTWKNFEEIFKLAIVCAVPRANDSLQELVNYGKALAGYGCKYIISDKMMMDVSSTLIRDNVKEGKAITGMVCKEVEKYIYNYSLYLG